MPNPANDALFTPELWKAALEKYATAAHLTVQLFDADEHAVLGPIHPTPLFELFDAKGYDPGIFAKCAHACVADADNRPAVRVSQFHGLSAVGTSLMLEGKIVGAAAGGYVFAEFSQVSEIHRLAREAGIDFERLWAVARKQQPVPERRLVVLGELLQTLGEALLRENFRTRQYQHAAAIINSSEDAIISENLHGIITSWNTGAHRLYGYTAPEAVGQPITLLFPPERFDEEPGILKRVREGQSIENYETVRRRKDGTLLDISLTVSPIADAHGRIVGASKIARDITERKQAEELMQSEAKRLEVLVQQRTAKLQMALGELEAFSYSVAHDLRAPLRAMTAYAQLLLKETSLSPEGQEYLQRIQRAAERLDRMTQEVLGYSQLSRAEINLQPIDLDKLVRDIVEQYPELGAPECEIHIPSPLLPMLGHEGFLTQALANLLINACKFVEQGARPRVVVRTEAIGQESVRLWVEDNGIGIAPEHRERLFKIFGRIHPEKKYEGTGIGLAIVKKAPSAWAARWAMNPSRARAAAFGFSSKTHRICVPRVFHIGQRETDGGTS